MNPIGSDNGQFNNSYFNAVILVPNFISEKQKRICKIPKYCLFDEKLFFLEQNLFGLYVAGSDSILVYWLLQISRCILCLKA